MAACALINKVRIAKGWGILPGEEGEVAAKVWIELLDTEGVPHTAYGELFRRAVTANANKRSQGVQPVEITPEYLLAFWVGSEGLRNEMAGVSGADEEAETRKAECTVCEGTGWERQLKDGYWGVIRCDHEPK